MWLNRRTQTTDTQTNPTTVTLTAHARQWLITVRLVCYCIICMRSTDLACVQIPLYVPLLKIFLATSLNHEAEKQRFAVKVTKVGRTSKIFCTDHFASEHLRKKKQMASSYTSQTMPKFSPTTASTH